VAAGVLERHAAVHLLVNNAGVPARGTFLRAEPAVIRRAIEVN
jgi:NAD(P)-dependent dehydrogenase (short-subunit alcohol dehydrogenase family)